MHDHPPAPPKHFQIFVKQNKSPLGSIIKFPPGGGQNKTDKYTDLVCTDQDRANIYELITTLAENSKLTLLLKQSYVKNLGAQINHVHPLKFLATIFTNPKLKECMNEIFDDYFKRSGFMDGLGSSLSREADKGKIEPYLNDFSTEIKVSVDQMRKYFQSRDWEGLVQLLMQS